MDSDEFEAGMSWLQETEQRLEGSAEGMVVVDEAQFRTLPVKIALAHSSYAQVQGDIEATVKYAELALELSPEEDLLHSRHGSRDPGDGLFVARRSGWSPKGP